MLCSLPSAVIDAWLHPRGVSDVAPVGGGLSGAVVYRARGAGDLRWAVRGWPSGVTAGRVDEIHRVMQLAHRQGCRWMPAVEPPGPASVHGAPSSRIVAEGRVWDCCQWMPGEPPSAGDSLGEVLRQSAIAVAEFHTAVRGVAEHQAPAAAVQSRLQRLAELAPQIDPLIADPSGRAPLAPPGSAIERAMECLRQVWAAQRRRSVQRLDPWADRSLSQQYVFRDIHIGNTLFQNGRLSGIIDYDAVRIDSPATDLARLIGSVRLALPPEQWEHTSVTLWESMLAAYRSVRSFSDHEEGLARVLEEVSPLITLANWLVWVVREGRLFPGPAARVDERIEGWTRIVWHQFALAPQNPFKIETR